MFFLFFNASYSCCTTRWWDCISFLSISHTITCKIIKININDIIDRASYTVITTLSTASIQINTTSFTSTMTRITRKTISIIVDLVSSIVDIFQKYNTYTLFLKEKLRMRAVLKVVDDALRNGRPIWYQSAPCNAINWWQGND